MHRRAFLCSLSCFSGRSVTAPTAFVSRGFPVATSWKNVNKFRLLTVIALSLLASVATAAGRESFSSWDVIQLFTQAGIAGFAYMQCPSDGRGSTP